MKGLTVLGCKGAKKVALAAPAVIKLLPAVAGRLARPSGGADRFDAGVAVGRLGAHLVDAKRHAVGRGCAVEALNGGLFLSKPVFK